MGLAGPKNRKKFSKDPNNTTWSRSEDRFGHKVLSGLGWKPGSTLGAQGTKHASRHNNASLSGIRIVLREEHLALGVKEGKENFGLDAFQSVLGRLNGKSEDTLRNEADARSRVHTMLRQEQRMGSVTFVSGGFLRMEDEIEGQFAKGDERSVAQAVPPRKQQREDQASLLESAMASAKAQDASTDYQPTRTTSKEDSGREKRKKKSKWKQKDSIVASEGLAAVNATPTGPGVRDRGESPQDASNEAPSKEERRREKADRSQARSERKARKEAKRLKKTREPSLRFDGSLGADEACEGNEQNSCTKLRTEAASAASAASIVLPTQPPPPQPPMRGRQLVRQRYIQQKRMAGMDEKALKEILMIRSQV